MKNHAKITSIDSKYVSPQLLPLGNFGSLISGQNPNGMVMGKRKLTIDATKLFQAEQNTSDANKVDLKSIAHDITYLCAKEYTRRFSGHS
jgi:hypothetical protein